MSKHVRISRRWSVSLALLTITAAALAFGLGLMMPLLQGGSSAQAASPPVRKVILVEGITSHHSGELEGNLRRELSYYLIPAVSDYLKLTDEDFLMATYSSYKDTGDYRTASYTAADTCVGTKRVRDSISAIVNDSRYAGAEFDIVGHSMGGFAAALGRPARLCYESPNSLDHHD